MFKLSYFIKAFFKCYFKPVKPVMEAKSFEIERQVLFAKL